MPVWTVASNSSNLSCDVFTYQESSRIIFPIFYSAVLLVSLAGNSLVLCVACQQKQKMNPTTIYLSNLAVSDALFTLALPGRITYYLLGFHWPFGDFTCRLTATIFYCNTYASIAFMTCISVDRYLAVLRPQRGVKLRRRRVVRGVCVLVWLVVLLETSPLLFTATVEPRGHARTCMEFPSFQGRRMAYGLLLACLPGFCVPLVIILWSYGRISVQLQRTARENPLASRSGSSRRAKTTILLILLSFVLCFSPYHLNIIRVLVMRLCHARPPSCEELRTLKMSLQVTVALMNLNCCLDPIIYFFAIKTYKERVVSFFKSYVSIAASLRDSSSST